MTEPNFPVSWLRLTKEHMDKLRAQPISSDSQMLSQIEMFTGVPIRREGDNWYVQLPPKLDHRLTWDSHVIEQVFSKQEMHINLEDLRAICEGHYGRSKEEIAELEEERERKSLREQLLAAQQEES